MVYSQILTLIIFLVQKFDITTAGVLNCQELATKRRLQEIDPNIKLDEIFSSNENALKFDQSQSIDTFETNADGTVQRIARRRRRLISDKCRPLERQEGIFASLFTTIAALKLFQQNQDIFGYKFDFTIADGTLLAQQRNVLIFPWDSDSDMYILFEKDLQTPQEFEKFRLDLANIIEYIDKLNKNEIAALPKPVSLEDVKIDIKDNDFINRQTENVYSDEHCEDKTCVTWNLDHGARNPAATENYFFLLHIESLASARGYTDLFIAQKDPNNEQRIRNDHCCVGFIKDYKDVSIIFPSNNSATWPIYLNVKVPIPAQTEQALSLDYGYNWYQPNVDGETLECPNFSPSDVENLIQVKYKAVFDIIASKNDNNKKVNAIPVSTASDRHQIDIETTSSSTKDGDSGNDQSESELPLWKKTYNKFKTLF